MSMFGNIVYDCGLYCSGFQSDLGHPLLAVMGVKKYKVYNFVSGKLAVMNTLSEELCLLKMGSIIHVSVTL